MARRDFSTTTIWSVRLKNYHVFARKKKNIHIIVIFFLLLQESRLEPLVLSLGFQTTIRRWLFQYFFSRNIIFFVYFYFSKLCHGTLLL